MENCHYGWTHGKFLPLYMPSQFVHESTMCFDKKQNWGEESNCSYSNSCDLQASPLTQEPTKTIFFVSLTRETQNTTMEKRSW